MHKVIVGIGSLMVVLGSIVLVAFFFGMPINVNPFSYFNVKEIILLEQAAISVFVIAVGSILILWGRKKS